MRPSRSTYLTVMVLILGSLTLMPSAAHAQLMIIGNDEKVSFDETGKVITGPRERTRSSLWTSARTRESPKILVNLPLTNSIVGPLVNLAITPDERLAIVANSLQTVPEGPRGKPFPTTSSM